MDSIILYISNNIISVITISVLVILVVILLSCVYSKYTQETFTDKEVNASTITMYHVDWCGYCKKAMPEFKKLQEYDGQIIHDNLLHVKLVDCDEEPEVAKKENISSYPTIKLEHKNKTHEYEGERTFQNLMDFLEEKFSD